MHNHRPRSLFALLLFSLILTACSAPASAQARDTLYQVSTINSLMAGNYDGIKTIQDVSKKGDTGIGTFDTLDGEMVMIDGTVYKVKSSGAVEKPDVKVTLPFSAVTYFDIDNSTSLGPVKNLDELKAALDKMIVKKDRFYAFRVDGTFATVQTRSVPAQQKPYPILSEVTKKQAVFNFESVKGSLIGFWCPETVGSINVPGYHLHFISDDRTKGGHLLNISFDSAKAMIDETRFFEMEIGEASAAGNINNAGAEIDKVEK
jgi:acetolactate decarboxylase